MKDRIHGFMVIEFDYEKIRDERVCRRLVILHGLLGSIGNWRVAVRCVPDNLFRLCVNEQDSLGIWLTIFFDEEAA